MQNSWQKKGYGRIKDKLKELRRGYKKCIDTGTRSGSERLIKLHFDTLKETWQGFPAVRYITCRRDMFHGTWLDDSRENDLSSSDEIQETQPEPSISGSQQQQLNWSCLKHVLGIKNNLRGLCKRNVWSHTRGYEIIHKKATDYVRRQQCSNTPFWINYVFGVVILWRTCFYFKKCFF